MKYSFQLFKNRLRFIVTKIDHTNSAAFWQMGAISNIYRQKKKVNNSKKYTEKEKRLIMKGLDMAIDRTWGVLLEQNLIIKGNKNGKETKYNNKTSSF